MPRAARVVIAGCPHHVVQRGHNREDIFFVDEDRERFLKELRNASRRFGLDVQGYCLMTNHLHLIVTPQREHSLAWALKRTNQLYAQYVNRMQGRSGHLWEDRFFSCPLGPTHFWRALAYVERNPVRAGVCRKPWRWFWSSAGAHTGGRDTSGLLDMASWQREMDVDEWRAELERPDDDRMTASLRLSTNRGRPLGDDAFIAKLEVRLGRRLRALPRGRPRRTDSRPPEK